MIIFKIISKFIKALRSHDSPSQIAWGITLGTILGLTPFFTVHNFILIILIILIKVNLSAVVFSLILYSLLGYFLDPVFHAIGFTLLVSFDFLQPVWVWLYNLPVAPFTRFNNTVVIGSLVCALIFLVPHYLLFKQLVVNYRTSWNTQIKKWKIIRMLQGNKLVQFYFKLRDWRG
ncbi:MAG: TIGR03546 family protein [bacterium]